MADPKPGKQRTLLVLSLVILSALILTMGHNCFSTFVPSGELRSGTDLNYALLAEASTIIEKVYVDRSAVKPRALTEGAVKGMVDALGDVGHSTFMTKEMIGEEQEFTEGRYQGVGLELRMEKGHAVVITPLDGSPAQKAGIRPGEIITKVGAKSLIGMDLMQIVKLILGPAGTSVRLTFFDPAQETTKVVVLTRAVITVENVRWAVLPGSSLAHLRVAGLSKGVSQSLHQALNQIEQRKLKGIILDLRDDPGGQPATSRCGMSMSRPGCPWWCW